MYLTEHIHANEVTFLLHHLKVAGRAAFPTLFLLTDSDEGSTINTLAFVFLDVPAVFLPPWGMLNCHAKGQAPLWVNVNVLFVFTVAIFFPWNFLMFLIRYSI